MKKLISLVLAISILLSCVCVFPITTSAEDATSGKCGDNLTWSYDTSTCTLTISGVGAMTDYGSSTYKGPSVTTAPWRLYYDTMKTLIIGNGVTSIGNYAFFCCENLTEVSIGNSVESIGEWAFYSCDRLTEVSMGNTVKSIGDGAFCECFYLASVTIGYSVTDIGMGAFYMCNTLTDVYYSGTEKEWNEILIGSVNDCLLNATIHYNCNYCDIYGHTFVDGICSYCHVVRPAGDISGDAKVNAVDSNLMKQIILDDAKTPEESKFADLNGDGKINAVDMNLLKQIILGE